jgi:hypothetical protein
LGASSSFFLGRLPKRPPYFFSDYFKGAELVFVNKLLVVGAPNGLVAPGLDELKNEFELPLAIPNSA